MNPTTPRLPSHSLPSSFRAAMHSQLSCGMGYQSEFFTNIQSKCMIFFFQHPIQVCLQSEQPWVLSREYNSSAAWRRRVHSWHWQKRRRLLHPISKQDKHQGRSWAREVPHWLWGGGDWGVRVQVDAQLGGNLRTVGGAFWGDTPVYSAFGSTKREAGCGICET